MKPALQLLLLLLLPTLAYAHGEEVLYTLFLGVGSLIVFFIAILIVPATYPEKAVLVTVYLLTLGVVICLTSNLPYLANMRLINTIICLAPPVACAIAFLLLWNRRRSQNAQE